MRLLTDPTAVWRQETVAVNASEVTFDRVVLRPKVLAVNIPISIELLEDSSNAATAIETAIQGSIGAAMDLAILAGTGASAEPEGIRNNGNVNTIGSVSTPTNYDEVNLAVGDVMVANFPGATSELAWIHHPREGDDAQHHQPAFEPADLQIDKCENRQDRHAEHDRHVLADNAGLHRHGPKKCREPQDQADVGDIGSDDVPNRERTLAGERCADRCGK